MALPCPRGGQIFAKPGRGTGKALSKFACPQCRNHPCFVSTFTPTWHLLRSTFFAEDLATCGEATMEAFGVSIIAAAPPSFITCCTHARVGNRKNGFTAASSSSFAQFGQAQEDRKFSAVSENVSVAEEHGPLRTISSNLVLSSLLLGFANAKAAVALSYDEVVGAVKEAATSSTDSATFGVPEVDTLALTDILSSNLLALLGGGAIIALPLLSAIFKKPESYGSVSAKAAFEKLGDKDMNSELLDIRDADGIKEGKPDLKVYKKKVTQVPFEGEPEEYVAKVMKKFKDAEKTTIFVLDRFDGDSVSVTKLLVKAGFEAAYSIKDGVEGPGGWQNSELPWLRPTKFSLGSFKDLISNSDTGSILPTTLGMAAAAGVGIVVFSEAETALQLLGSAALAQLFVKKFLFAADRKKTVEELKTFLDTKVAPKEIVDELKEIAEVILPKYEEAKEGSVNGAAVLESSVTDGAVEMAATVEDKASTLSSEIAGSDETKTPVPTEPEEDKQEIKEPESTVVASSTELPQTSRPLSPYAQYPGFKPPSSPTPSRP